MHSYKRFAKQRGKRTHTWLKSVTLIGQQARKENQVSDISTSHDYAEDDLECMKCTTELVITMDWEVACSYLEANEDKGRINFERGSSDDRPSDVHQGVKEAAEVGRGALQGDNEGFTAKTLVCKVKQSDDTLAEANGGSPLAIHIERLGLSREFEDDTAEIGTKVRRRNGDPLGKGQSLQTILWKDGHQEIEGVVFVDGGALAASAGAAVTAAIWGQRWGGEVGVDPARDGARGRGDGTMIMSNG